MKNKNALDGTHWIWAKFDEFNSRHFRGRLERPQQILRSNFGAWGAATVNKTVDGVPCRMIWIDGDTLDANPAESSDSLLHEMIHYELAFDADGDGDQEHGVRFTRRADEIGRTLGLPACTISGFTPDQTKEIASVWPRVQREASKVPR